MGQEQQLRYYKPASLDFLRDFETDAREIIDEGTYTNGQRAKELCANLSHRTGYAHVLPFGGVNQAILLLARWYWKQGYRRILTPAFTWPSTYKPFDWLGYKIAFVDVDEKTWLADFGDLQPSMDELPIPVDTFGSSWAPSTDGIPRCPFVDSAQSLGAKWKDTTPTRIVSFSGSKILTSGEGGILLTQDQELADFATNQNWFSRLSELSALLALAYLDHFDDILEKKQRIAEAYRKRFPSIGWQTIPNDTNHYIVSALVDSPREWEKANPQVEFRKYYDAIVNEEDEPVRFEQLPQWYVQPLQDGTGTVSSMMMAGLKNTDYISRHIIAFPAWPDMPLDAIERMVEP